MPFNKKLKKKGPRKAPKQQVPRKVRKGAKKAAKQKGFRLASKQLFLTYPVCPLTVEEVLKQLSDIVPIVEYIVAQEKHEDGQLHIHAYVCCDPKVETRNANFLDLVDPDNEHVYHGNYQGCKNAMRVQRYCKKGNVFITNMKFNQLQEAIKMAKNQRVVEALEAVSDARPDMILNNRDRVISNLQGIAADAAELAGKWGHGNSRRVPQKALINRTQEGVQLQEYSFGYGALAEGSRGLVAGGRDGHG